MIDLWLRPDEFGGVDCTLTDGKTTATVSANKSQDATADLLDCIEKVNTEGVAECFWTRSSGLFRWLLRKESDRVRLVVLWSSGTITGWENVFWSETDWASLQSNIRSAVKSL